MNNGNVVHVHNEIILAVRKLKLIKFAGKGY